MSSVISKITKRHAFPVTIDGETVHLCAMTHAQTRAVAQLDESLQQTYVVACCLVNDAGERLCERRSGESTLQYADRAAEVFGELTFPVLKELIDEINRVSRPPSVETATKN